tara:strand:+ start:234 stop:413 length:180 start_codon:yes stop_codon:yes gene_type:complete
VGRILFGLSVVAFFINIFLLVFASVAMDGAAADELQVLSLVNMILLSFVLLREPNQKTE